MYNLLFYKSIFLIELIRTLVTYWVVNSPPPLPVSSPLFLDYEEQQVLELLLKVYAWKEMMNFWNKMIL